MTDWFTFLFLEKQPIIIKEKASTEINPMNSKKAMLKLTWVLKYFSK